MANPSVVADPNINGVWLIPHIGNAPVVEEAAWIGATSPSLSAEVSRDEFTIFNRREELSQDGVLHLDRGQIDDGLLMDRHGQTAATWLTRLQNLIRQQRSYGFVVLSSPSWEPFRVKINDLSKSITIAGGLAYRVSFSFREVT
jgi:hypothetical protein